MALVTIRLSAAARPLLRALLEGLTLANLEHFRAGRLPPLYASGVRWRAAHPGSTFDDGVVVASRRWGDCGDVSAYYAAELRHTGVDPTAYVDLLVVGPTKLHAIVVRHHGTTTSDPSRVLGMGVK